MDRELAPRFRGRAPFPSPLRPLHNRIVAARRFFCGVVHGRRSVEGFGRARNCVADGLFHGHFAMLDSIRRRTLR